MKKIEVLYCSGESRYDGEPVDYMRVRVPSSDGDMVELYAERHLDDYLDWEAEEALRDGRIEWETLLQENPELETCTYADLKADILSQAEMAGVNPSILHFGYDKE